VANEDYVPVSQRKIDVSVAADAPTEADLKTQFGRDIFRDFDVNDQGFNDHMVEALDLQARHCPIAHSKVGEGYFWLTRNEDIRRVGQDWKTFSNAKGYMPNRPEGMPFIYPIEMDPPKQTAWRQVLNPLVSPRVVAGFEAAIREDANTLIDRFIDKGHCEFISEFGAILPGWAFFKNSLGVPVELLGDLVHSIERSLFGPLDQRAAQLGRAFVLLEEYLLRRAKEAPRGDMVDTILAGVVYEDGTPASWQDKLGIIADMTLGGIGTTTYVLGSTLNYLANHPADRRMLIEKPELMSNAVEEFVRMFPPVIGSGRNCTRDVEVAGTQMKKGDWVVLAWAASSRDPDIVEDPHKLDITRENIVHTTFGVGPHRCVGSNMARAELKVSFEEWLKRIPDFAVKAGTAPIYETSHLRSMSSLHLEW
jgi:cytochrome P450